jgi:hypothetical protein
VSSQLWKQSEYALIQEGLSEDISLQTPRFVTEMKSLEHLIEGDNIHFECRLEPITDGQLAVEWFHNGEPLRSGHRHKAIHDFGFVSLDILSAYPEVDTYITVYYLFNELLLMIGFWRIHLSRKIT